MDIDLLQELSDAFGPSGFEEEVVRVVTRHASEFSPEWDAFLNVYCALPGNRGDRPRVMLDAHLDECGFMVHSIRPDGMLEILPLGGWHPTNVPAHAVLVRNRAGEKFPGITTSKAVHFLTERERKDTSLVIEDICVDVGATSKEEVRTRFGIRPGDPIAPDVRFSGAHATGMLRGKAFDNRIGCACVIETMRALRGEHLAVDLFGALAAQEEVGSRGAEVTRAHVRPDLAIVFEGSPADDYFLRGESAQCALRRGVQIRHRDNGYIASRPFLEMAEEIADRLSIRYQDAVRRGGSTNAAKISLYGDSVPTLVLGIPCRYVHTHHNFAAPEDVESAVALAVALIRQLAANAIGRIRRCGCL